MEGPAQEILFDPEYYRLCRPALKAWFENHSRTEEDFERGVSQFAASQGCHIIAAFVFYGEMFGMTERVQFNIDRLLRFYRFTGLKGLGGTSESQ